MKFSIAVVRHAEQAGNPWRVNPAAGVEVAAVVSVPDLEKKDALEFVFELTQNTQENDFSWAKEGGDIIAVATSKRPSHRSTTAGDIVSLFGGAGHNQDFQVTDIGWVDVTKNEEAVA